MKITTMLSKGKNIDLQHLHAKKIGAINETNHSRLTEVELWIAFRAGDEAAFIHIYNQYVNRLFNYGCQFTPDKEMVKDCLQDFFVYLRNNRAGFSDTAYVKLYLLKAFKRRVIDYIKKNNREIKKNESYAFFQFPVELSSETLYINRQIQEEQMNKLNKALKNLANKEREAIYCFYYEGLSYKQIAELFDFSHVSSARRLIYRALSQLKKLIVILFASLVANPIP